VAHEEGEADGFVEDAREGMRGVESDGGEEGIDLVVEVLGGEGTVGGAELFPLEDADAGGGKLGDEVVVPAGGLFAGKVMEPVAEFVEASGGSEAAFVGLLGKAEGFFELLEDAGDADFDELVEVAGGNGEELDALEQRIGAVFGFFEDAAIEEEPALVAIDEAAFRVSAKGLEGRGLWFGCGPGGDGGAGCGGGLLSGRHDFYESN
jgi:hypothetical protein